MTALAAAVLAAAALAPAALAAAAPRPPSRWHALVLTVAAPVARLGCRWLRQEYERLNLWRFNRSHSKPKGRMKRQRTGAYAFPSKEAMVAAILRHEERERSVDSLLYLMHAQLLAEAEDA